MGGPGEGMHCSSGLCTDAERFSTTSTCVAGVLHVIAFF